MFVQQFYIDMLDCYDFKLVHLGGVGVMVYLLFDCQEF